MKLVVQDTNFHAARKVVHNKGLQTPVEAYNQMQKYTAILVLDANTYNVRLPMKLIHWY